MENAAKQAAEQAQEQGGRMKAELGGVVVLDFGGQYTQLIARRIREQQVFSAVLPCTTSIEEIRKLEPAGIILSGGPSLRISSIEVIRKLGPPDNMIPAGVGTQHPGAGDLLRD